MILNLLLLLCFIGALYFMQATYNAATKQDEESRKRQQLMRRVQQLRNKLDGVEE